MSTRQTIWLSRELRGRGLHLYREVITQTICLEAGRDRKGLILPLWGWWR